VTRHLIVIGGQRCGTTYLHSLLDAHPEIAMARPARPEPKVFLSADSTARGLEWYESTYFSHATSESLLGEKSTSYIEHAGAASRAASVLGEAEIIVLLRDPVARAISNWQFSTENGLERRPLGQALADNLADTQAWDTEATSVSPYAYLERGRYAGYLDVWYTNFPGKVHVLFFEELVSNHEELAGLYEALSVERSFRPNVLGQRINSSQRSAPELEPGLAARLREYFRESDIVLCKLLGRELPWPHR
jgi:hypothetical protein